MIKEYIYGGVAVEETRERQAHRTRSQWLLLLGLVFLVAVPLAAFGLLYRQVRPVTVWELTGGCPPASALMKDGGEAAYAFDADRIDWTKPGDAWVLVAGSDGPRIALVRVTDTTAPAARGVSRVLGVDEEAGPDAFVADLADRQPVGVSFERAPRFHAAGEYPVVIRLEDLSGNVSFVETSCTILGAVPRLTIEAGEPVPPLADFLPNDTLEGRFVTDVTALDTSVPGVYAIEVEAAGETYETILAVTDTAAPVCTFETAAWARPGEAPRPESLVTGAEDASALTYGFEGDPDWDREGYREAVVTVTDAAGNRTCGTVMVLISRLEPLVWEAGRSSVSGMAVAQRQRALDPAFSGEVVLDSFTPRTLGCYDVNALVDGEPCVQRLYVVDTAAPKLAFAERTRIYVDHPRAPAELLETAEDGTDLTLFYTAEPDWSREGVQHVAVAAVDAAGNRTEIEGTVRILRDEEKPQILGVTDRYVYVGDTVAYFATVRVTDNADAPEDVALTVDNAAVNLRRAGSYPVVYRAVDRAGNAAERRIRLHVMKVSVSDEKLNAKADEILERIVTDGMTPAEKAFAIYGYIYDTYHYSSSSDKREDWKREAWRGLTRRRGGCFTFCAAAKVLLERTGAQAMFITRNSGTRHDWLLVNVGTGWYHFDPLNSGPSAKYRCCMLTTEQVQTLYPNFWRFNEKLYPATATEPFAVDGYGPSDRHAAP